MENKFNARLWDKNITDLVNKIKILEKENTRLGKSTYKKGRVIEELEKWLQSEYDRYSNDKENLVFSNVEVIDFQRVLDKLKELKEIYIKDVWARNKNNL